MRQAATLILAGFAGFALGAGLIEGLHAQANNPTPAYVVAEVEVTDPPAYAAYLKSAIESLAPYRARVVARGKPDVKEGAPPQGNIVMVAFDSVADAEKWYSTPPYKDLIAERQKSAKTRLYIVEGVPQ
ncbi:MAG: DUF1330 domain-containing protein [Alphaproteobacteria bacterium]|nr:DUF1330 domain-containing protein [Alphaproteobacteria bacterium]